MTRKDFFLLTFTLVGTGVAATACSSSSSNGDGGKGGGGGSGGSGGAGGSGGSGGGGSGGSGGGDGGGGACIEPLPEAQVHVAATDNDTHMHAVVVTNATLNATSDQTINTTLVNAHMHAITLTAANLVTLKGGGTVTVTSTSAGTGAMAHTHSYMVACHALADAGSDGAGSQ